jgi:hypothetical protein
MIQPYKGINYDTGFEPYGPANSSRKVFDPNVVSREMQIIVNDLRCTHVRITGADPARIALAASYAVKAGLSVWFSPFPCNLTSDQLIPYLVDCAMKAAEIGQLSADTVLVLGCELSLFNHDFLPGNHLLERTQAFAEFGKWKPEMNEKLRAFFEKVIPAVRRYFSGKLTYAAGEWEAIDWSVFDIVSVDLYRAKHNQAYYAQQLQTYLIDGKPLAITEFGCCPVKGGAELGGNATFTVLSLQESGLVVNEGWQYSEEEQVDYLETLFSVFKASGVAFAFWFTFATYEKQYSDISKHNLDMASYGIVQMLSHAGKAYPDMCWEPRKVFGAIGKLQ